MASLFPRLLARRRRVVVLLVLAVVVAGGFAVLALHSPGNVSHPNISFTAPTTSTQTTPAATHKKGAPDNFEWPRYGFNAARTRFLPGAGGLHPPFRVGWRYGGNALLEFPPVMYRNSLYFIDDSGTAKSINKHTGRRFWQRGVGTLAAASPAVGVREHLVFFPLLSTNGNAGHKPGNGRLVALSMWNGRVVWSRRIAPGTESSPLVWKTTLYIGDQGGNVYSLRAGDGHVNWIYHASGAVKGGITLADGIVYFGDYSGHMYALNAENGHVVWKVGTDGTAFGFGSGNFYSTPAVAFGRVYIGNTDGRVYSFAARTGQLAWATGTGAYVYASPVVADVSGLGPTVFLGSYDGNFYAFNAQSGAVRWRHNAGGRISGSATLIDGVVYFADLGTKTTIGLDARTGRTVFRFGDGAFNPVIADPRTIYMCGYSTLYQLIPKNQPSDSRSSSNASKKSSPRSSSKRSKSSSRTTSSKRSKTRSTTATRHRSTKSHTASRRRK